MAAVVVGGYKLCAFWGNSMATAAAIVLGGVIYFAILLILGGITAEEVASMPKIGPKAAKIIAKIVKKS